MENGLPLKFDRDSVSSYMRTIVRGEGKQTLFIHLIIGNGSQKALAWGCDLSPEYVHINADYTT